MKSIDARSEQSLGLSELIGTPPVGVIFLDYDGVFVQDAGRFEKTPGLRNSTIDTAKEAGYWVVFNSDSGTDMLATKADEYGVDKTIIIGEKGAVISLPTIGRKEYLSPFKPFFDRIKPDVITMLKEKYPSASIYKGDATSYIQNTEKVEEKSDCMYLLNTSRETSLGIYVRAIDTNGSLMVDQEATEQLKEDLDKLLMRRPESTLLESKAYPAVGSCLVRDPRISKVTAVKWIMDQYPKGLEYYMIGDSKNDDISSLGVMTCAVGNADYGFKVATYQSGGMVAPQNRQYADGADFLLRQIVEGGGGFEQTAPYPRR